MIQESILFDPSTKLELDNEFENLYPKKEITPENCYQIFDKALYDSDIVNVKSSLSYLFTAKVEELQRIKSCVLGDHSKRGLWCSWFLRDFTVFLQHLLIFSENIHSKTFKKKDVLQLHLPRLKITQVEIDTNFDLFISVKVHPDHQKNSIKLQTSEPLELLPQFCLAQQEIRKIFFRVILYLSKIIPLKTFHAFLANQAEIKIFEEIKKQARNKLEDLDLSYSVVKPYIETKN